MHILTKEEMKKIDKLTSEEYGIGSEILMEQAGISIYNEIIKNFKKNTHFLFVLGTGNNGGDGLAAARLLYNEGYKNLKIIIIGNNQSNLFKKQLEIIKKFKFDNFIKYDKNFENHVSTADCIIDGLIGIGLKDDLKEETQEVINIINSKKRGIVISIDIPSGIDANTGKISKNAIKADKTITFGSYKLGHIFFPGREYSGKIIVAPLSFPKDLFSLSHRELVTSDMVKKLLPKRPKFSQKYDFGNVLILAGSSEFPGASVLSAIGAQKIGAGLVKLITPSSLSSSVLEHEPGIIYKSLNKNKFSLRDIDIISKDIKKASVIVIGPGLGRSNETMQFVRNVVEYSTSPIVVDADALYAVDALALRKNIVLTPHVGEMQRIVRTDEIDIRQNYDYTEYFAKNKKATIVFKDVTTTITNGEKTYFNITGNTALSKGGSGDLLTGIIAGLIAQGLNVMEASIIASYLLGRTAEIVSAEKTEYYTTPLDIAKNLYKALLEVINA
ncbi:NAD(P)H-hydrate epimerase [Marinitoga hydrogenitolerans DSM 16785]|uniref:Bifunctional NAD(P)H-hydrate repair enzyme n=1 Tax=Marinitoga hydrogenitolerans (strain DSM 16785 / JCM 12826 / AT1271) TaxID=1122195 RepID=A0A1M4Y9U2_MARH1|nr:bifunctional ADP-dependent NAD(P)H-hydrate dehydratase/NAD(P)H-hydrate epimerase [Marinitoga hydrogenitolerans]SHF02419.1 NAD(P)H-hydrate epimerase [Marinitoga hydrogenitolerans DSM 16785]